MTSAGSSSNSAMSNSFLIWTSRPLIWLIYVYRMTLAPFMATFFGGGCRFEPSCSHYAEDAICKYGAWRGSIMAVKRIFRCHPWHDGGYDPVK
jgi:putative membrane protein insertion efficiency factor